MAQWVEACGANDIDEEDVIRFEHTPHPVEYEMYYSS